MVKANNNIYKNIVLVIIILISIILNGCITRKKCNNKFPLLEVKSDSIVIKHDTTIIYKDTLIRMEPDTTYIEYIVTCDTSNNKPKDFIKTSKSGKSNATVELKNGKLKVECLCEEEQMLITKLKEQVTIYESKISKEKEKQIIREKYIPTIYKYSLYLSIIILILLALYILKRVNNVFKFIRL